MLKYKLHKLKQVLIEPQVSSLEKELFVKQWRWKATVLQLLKLSQIGLVYSSLKKKQKKIRLFLELSLKTCLMSVIIFLSSVKEFIHK